MNIYSIITAIAIITIIIPFAYSGLSVFGAQQLEYRWHYPGDFSFFTMSNHGEIEFCNPIPFWITLQKLDVVTFYDANQVGLFTVSPITLDPLSSGIQRGVFTSENMAETQAKFMTLDFEFDGGDIRLDPTKLIVIMQIDTPIIGVIPYSSTFQISGFEFDQMMNAENLSCD